MTTIALGTNETKYFSISKLERFSDGSGWRGLLTMRSGAFAVIEHKFYFDDLPGFRDQILNIYNNLEGSATLRQRYENDLIMVAAITRGHVAVTGHFDTHTPEANHLDMEFILDQTYLPALISSISLAIEETESRSWL